MQRPAATIDTSLGILDELRRRGLISELRPHILKLNSLKYRMPVRSVRELMLEFQEEPE